MNKFVSKTLEFLGIIIFVTLFGKLFGSKNSLVGVYFVISILILKWKNMTVGPIRNFGEFLIMALFMAIATFVSSQNMYLGIFVNFLALAGIGYFYGKDLSRAMVIPSGLGYIFMMSNPVDIDRQSVV